MSQFRTRYLSRRDVRPQQTWELVEWCVEHGATEFTLSRMSLGSSPATLLTEFEDALAPFRSTPAPRELMTVLLGRPRVQTIDLWTLSSESVAALRRFLPEGLFSGSSNDGMDTGCVEDPTFYRRGEVMLGVISHEGIGVLSLTPSEHRQVAAIGIPTHDEPVAN